MAIGAGSATVTAKYGDKTVSIKTDVETSRFLDLSEDKLSLNAKESKKLKLTATYVTGTEEDITSKAEWKSSNEDIAFVSAGKSQVIKQVRLPSPLLMAAKQLQLRYP